MSLKSLKRKIKTLFQSKFSKATKDISKTIKRLKSADLKPNSIAIHYRFLINIDLIYTLKNTRFRTFHNKLKMPTFGTT